MFYGFPFLDSLIFLHVVFVDTPVFLLLTVHWEMLPVHTILTMKIMFPPFLQYQLNYIQWNLLVLLKYVQSHAMHRLMFVNDICFQ